LLWIGAILCFISYSIDGDQTNLYLGIVLAIVVSASGAITFL
jgi:hypothetical protein